MSNPTDDRFDGSRAKEAGMVLLAAFVLSVILVPCCGGRLQRLAQVNPRHGWTLPAALVLQLFATTIVPGAGEGILQVVHLASYALAAVFLLANLKLPGLPLLTTGAALNVAAIAANGGVMPARAGALSAAGIPRPAPGQFANSTAVAHAHLWFLGDVFAWPRPLPLHNVFSVGDILIVMGAAIAIHRISGSRIWPKSLVSTSIELPPPLPAWPPPNPRDRLPSPTRQWVVHLLPGERAVEEGIELS
jgi:hypothetical protein